MPDPINRSTKPQSIEPDNLVLSEAQQEAAAKHRRKALNLVWHAMMDEYAMPSKSLVVNTISGRITRNRGY